jgi:hypothetical protein
MTEAETAAVAASPRAALWRTCKGTAYTPFEAADHDRGQKEPFCLVLSVCVCLCALTHSHTVPTCGAVLVIDEVSMLDGRYFDMMDMVARAARRCPDRPFGGIQLILSGDFFQLPPVAKGDADDAVFCFRARAWAAAGLHTVLLTRVHRQVRTGVWLYLCMRMCEGRG